MVTSYTDAGTPVLDLTAEEYDAFLEREVQRLMGISVDEFVRQVQVGEIEWDHPEALHVAGLVDLDLRLNGHYPTAA